jgi:hypothetical protein
MAASLTTTTWNIGLVLEPLRSAVGTAVVPVTVPWLLDKFRV